MSLLFSSLTKPSLGGIEITPVPSAQFMTAEGLRVRRSHTIRKVPAGRYTEEVTEVEGSSFGIVVTGEGTIECMAAGTGPGWTITLDASNIQLRRYYASNSHQQWSYSRNQYGIPANTTFTLTVYQYVEEDTVFVELLINGLSLVRTSITGLYHAFVRHVRTPMSSVTVNGTNLYVRDAYFKNGEPLGGWIHDRLMLRASRLKADGEFNLRDMQNKGSSVEVQRELDVRLVAENHNIPQDLLQATATVEVAHTSNVYDQPITTFSGDGMVMHDEDGSSVLVAHRVAPTPEVLKAEGFRLKSSVSESDAEFQDFPAAVQPMNVEYLPSLPIYGELRSASIVADGEYLYAFGGYGENGGAQVEVYAGLYTYHIPSGAWFCQGFPRRSSTVHTRDRSSALLIGKDIYLSSGNYQAEINTALVVRPNILRVSTDTHPQRPGLSAEYSASTPAIAGREYGEVSLVQVGQYLYEFSNNTDGVCAVFNTETYSGVKLEVAHTRLMRRDCAILLNGLIYLFGCADGRGRPRAVYTVEPETGDTHLVAFSSFDLDQNHGLYVINGNVYVLGGASNLAHRFSAEFNNFQPLGAFTDAEYPIFDYDSGYCQVGEELYLLGGVDGNNFARITLPESFIGDNEATVRQEPERGTADLLYRLDDTLRGSAPNSPDLIPMRGSHGYIEDDIFEGSHSLLLNGKYGVATDDLELGGSLGFTAGAWFKLDATTDEADLLTFKGDLVDLGFGLRIKPDGTLTYHSTLPSSTFSTPAFTVPFGVRTHIAFVMSLSGVTTLFVDGEPVMSQRVRYPTFPLRVLNVGFNDEEESPTYLKGSASDVFAFSRELFNVEIAWIASGWDRLEPDWDAPADAPYPKVEDFDPVFQYDLDGDVRGTGKRPVPLTIVGNSRYVLDSPHSDHSRSFDFTGSNGLMGPMNDAPLKGPKAFSLSLWVKSDVLTTGNQFLIEQILQRNGTHSGNHGSFRLYMGRTGQLYFQLYMDDNIVREDSTQAILRRGRWHHIAAVREASGRTRLYFDAKLGATLDIPLSDLMSYHQLKVGFAKATATSGNGSFFQGTMCEVLGFDRALTEREVAWLAVPDNKTQGDLYPPYSPPDQFLGELAGANLINGDALYEEAGNPGTKQSVATDVSYLMFDDEQGRLLHVAKYPISSHVNAEILNNLGIMYGEKEVTLHGNKYKLRLLTGADTHDHVFPTRFNSPNVSKSEWNRLIGQVMSVAGTGSDLSLPGFWPTYTVANLRLGNQSTVVQGFTANGLRTAIRGASDGVGYITYSQSNQVIASQGWRPVLELMDRAPKPNITFLGEVSPDNFISNEALTLALDIEAGVTHNALSPWLKYRTPDGRYVLVAKQTLRYGVSYEDLLTADVISGNRTVEINNRKYRVRLISAFDELPETLPEGFVDTESEWKLLMQSVHDGVHAEVGNTSPAGHWPIYSQDILNVGDDDGGFTICRESVGDECVVRGFMGMDYVSSVNVADTDPSLGWRPVLEEMEVPQDLYRGEVEAQGFVSAQAIATSLNIAGTVVNGESSWLEFVTAAGIKMYVAKNIVMTDVSYNDLEAAGVVNGESTVIVQGRTYKVRLLTGSSVEPHEGTYGLNPEGTSDSEWDRLLYPVYSGADSVVEDMTLAGYWPEFSADQLIGVVGGCATLTLNSDGVNAIVRGDSQRISDLQVVDKELRDPTVGWRPVLEQVPPQMPEDEFRGELPSNEVISSATLVQALGVSEGTAMAADFNWLKFQLAAGNEMYIAKRGVRTSLSYNTLDELGAITGDAKIALNGVPYVVRLLSGSTEDPFEDVELEGYGTASLRNSEWTRLLGSIHTGEHSDENNSSFEGYWPIYNDTQLGLNTTNSASYTMEKFTVLPVMGEDEEGNPIEGELIPHVVTRGAKGIDHVKAYATDYALTDVNWRPVLEEIMRSTLVHEQPQDLPLFYYPFDGNSHCEGKAPVPLTLVGSGFLFDEDDPHNLGLSSIRFDQSYYLRGANSPLSGTGAMSYGMWLKPTNLTQSSVHMLGLIDASSSVTQLAPQLSGAGLNCVRHKINGVGPDSNNGSIAEGQWMHVAFTRSAEGVLTLYLNGVPLASDEQAVHDISALNTMFIGTANTSVAVATRFIGLMKDLWAYDRELTPAEIAWLSKPGNRIEIVPSKPEGDAPVALLRLNDHIRNEGSSDVFVTAYGELTFSAEDFHERGSLSYLSTASNLLSATTSPMLGTGTFTSGIKFKPSVIKNCVLYEANSRTDAPGWFAVKLLANGAVQYMQANGNVISLSAQVKADVWNNVAVIRHALGSIWIIVNGRLVGFSQAGAIQVVEYLPHRFSVGAGFTTVGPIVTPVEGAEGYIQDVWAYDRELTQNEIAWLTEPGNVMEADSEWTEGVAEKPSFTYMGEVPIVNGELLADLVGLEEGVAQNSDEMWLEFELEDGRKLLIAKKPMRHSLSAATLEELGLVYDDVESVEIWPEEPEVPLDPEDPDYVPVEPTIEFPGLIELYGAKFKLRLLKGSNENPRVFDGELHYAPQHTELSEWDKYLGSVHNGRHVHGSITATKGYWPLFSDEDLQLRHEFGLGASCFTQEGVDHENFKRVTRGGLGLTSLVLTTEAIGDEFGWRPVLEEYIEPVEPEVPTDPEPTDPEPTDPEEPADPDLEVPTDPEPEVPTDPEPEVPGTPEDGEGGEPVVEPTEPEGEGEPDPENPEVQP